MKTPQNIQCFNQAVGLVLGELYQNFPKPVFLDVRDLMANEGFPEECREDLDARFSGKNFISATIRFLGDEGFIRHTGEGGGGLKFTGVILTSKGFATLSSVPKSVKIGEPTLGQRLLQNIGQIAANETVQLIFKHFAQ